MTVTLEDGSKIVDELALADAHPDGARPFGRDDYKAKFLMLSTGVLSEQEQQRFLAAAEGLADLKAGELGQLNFIVAPEKLGPPRPRGIFDRS